MSIDPISEPLLMKTSTDKPNRSVFRENPIQNVLQWSNPQKYSIIQRIDLPENGKAKVVFLRVCGYGKNNFGSFKVDEIHLDPKKNSIKADKNLEKRIVTINCKNLSIAYVYNNFFAAGTTGGKIKLYTNEKYKILQVQFGNKSSVEHLTLTKNYIAAATVHKIRIWRWSSDGTAFGSTFGKNNPYSAELVRSKRINEKISGLDFNEANRKIALLTSSNRVFLLDLQDKQFDTSFSIEGVNKLRCLKIISRSLTIIGTDKGAIQAEQDSNGSYNKVSLVSLCGDDIFAMEYQDQTLILGMRKEVAFYSNNKNANEFKKFFYKQINIEPIFIQCLVRENYYLIGNSQKFVVFSFANPDNINKTKNEFNFNY